MQELAHEEIRRAVSLALEEDVGAGDVTTLATVAEQAVAEALMVAREPLTVAGIAFAVAAFNASSVGGIPARAAGRRGPPNIQIQVLVKDGEKLRRGQTMLSVQGSARVILTAERAALNFVQRLSGVATAATQYVEAVRGTKAVILDTRKTTPGWRRFEKYAVACGGAQNHRFGLHDMVLIKDNHLASIPGPGVILTAVTRARAAYPGLKVEVEADTLEQVREAADAGVDFVLCDNMDLDTLSEAVRIVNGRAKIEASGGVNLGTVRGIAETGVDYISVGAMTHSARAVDVALDFIPTPL